MDEVERTSYLPGPEPGRTARRAAECGAVVLSVNRGLWGEVSGSLRSVRVGFGQQEIHLFCYFAGGVSEDEQEAMQTVGSSVAADFPDYQVFERCIPAERGAGLSGDDH